MQNFDLDGALARCDGDEDLLRELIKICIEDSTTKLSEIKEAGETGDFKKLETSAHSMKSAMGNVGGVECHKILLSLEKLGRSETVDGFQILYLELLKKYELFLKEATKF